MADAAKTAHNKQKTSNFIYNMGEAIAGHKVTDLSQTAAKGSSTTDSKPKIADKFFGGLNIQGSDYRKYGPPSQGHESYEDYLEEDV